MKPTSKKTTTLPDELEEKTLQHMGIGESAWTLPWGMWVDRKRQCWLHPEYPAYNEPGGTVQMRVTRSTDGYHVETPASATYKPQNGPSYVGADNATKWLPVATISSIR